MKLKSMLILLGMLVYVPNVYGAGEAALLNAEKHLLKEAISKCVDVNYVSTAPVLKAALNDCIDAHIALRVATYSPQTPPPNPNPTMSVFPDTIVEFDNTTTLGTGAYKGTAAIVFKPSWDGRITTVSLNGEIASRGDNYKGCPVFRFLKVGTAYTQPLKFIITTKDIIYSYVITTTGTTPTVDVGAGKKFSSSGGSLRTKELGTAFGSSIKVVWENGYSVVIPDTNQRFEIKNRVTIYRRGGGQSDKDQYWTSHGGMGVWTTQAGNSKYAIIYKVK